MIVHTYTPLLPPPPAAGTLDSAAAPKSLQAIYDALVSRIADECPDSGYADRLDLFERAAPLTDEEIAAVCELHADAIIHYLSVDPPVVARLLRGDIEQDELRAYLRKAAETAVITGKVSLAVIAECDRRADLAATDAHDDYCGGAFLTPHERREAALGVARLFRP